MTPAMASRYIVASAHRGFWTDQDGIVHEVRSLVDIAHKLKGMEKGSIPPWREHVVTSCLVFGWYRDDRQESWSPEYTFPDVGISMLKFADKGIVTSCLQCLTARTAP